MTSTFLRSLLPILTQTKINMIQAFGINHSFIRKEGGEGCRRERGLLYSQPRSQGKDGVKGIVQRSHILSDKYSAQLEDRSRSKDK